MSSPDDHTPKARSKSESSVIKAGLEAATQTRYIILGMCMLNTFISFALRASLNLTIVSMVKPSEHDSNANESVQQVCPDWNKPQEQFELMTNITDTRDVITFDWSESLQGFVLGSYYYGYTSSNIHAAQLGAMVGSRLLLALAMLVSSVFTFIIPFIAPISVWLVCASRFLVGAAQGLVMAAIFDVLANWIPRANLGLALSLNGASLYLGQMSAMPISAALVQVKGLYWPSVFYVFGIAGAVFIPIWYLLVYDTPWQHPRISDRELAYLRSTIIVSGNTKSKKVPWCRIFTSRKIWLFAFSRFAGSWGSNLLVTKLPKYLETVLHMPITLNGYINAAVYIAICSSLIICGRLADYIDRNRLLGRTLSRRLFQSVALLGGAIFMSLVPAFGCESLGVVAMLLAAMFAYGFIGGSEYILGSDIAPELSGTIYGFTNAIASLTGFMAPLLVGFLLDQAGPEGNPMTQWSIIFWISAGIYILGTLAIWFVKAEPEPWAVAKDETAR